MKLLLGVITLNIMSRSIFILILLQCLEPLFLTLASTTQKDITAPTITPAATNAGSNAWCVARDSSSDMELQTALDYACGIGKADCFPIQLDGRCYNPNSLKHHASYAFNSYYRKNLIPESCNFGGTAVVTSVDPSSKTCQYPPTSTSTTILSITNLNSSTIFGTRPSSPETPTSCAKTAELVYLKSFILVVAAFYFELL